MDIGLQSRLWRFVKDRRDALERAQQDYDDARRLLSDMQAAGMDSHLPTIEEVQAAFRALNTAEE